MRDLLCPACAPGSCWERKPEPVDPALSLDVALFLSPPARLSKSTAVEQREGAGGRPCGGALPKLEHERENESPE